MEKRATDGHAPQRESTIEVRVEEISQLFDTLDPYPFRERDLDKDAAEFIIGWARELPRRRPITLLVHLPKDEAGTRQAALLPEALGLYFKHRADSASWELNELFRVGRRSLSIGIGVLAVCLLLGQFINGRLGASYPARFVEESLVILGWVANWRPIEVFLYDWVPIKRRRDLFRRLASAKIDLVPYERPGGPNAL